MSHTKARVLQYIVILLVLAIGGGGYWYWQNAQAAVARKAADKTGLVAYWSFDEGNGTKLGDASGNGKHATLGTAPQTPAWVDGKFGKALSFDGVQDSTGDIVNIPSVAVGSTLPIANTHTVSMWVHPVPAGHPGYQVLLTADWGNGLYYYSGANKKINYYYGGDNLSAGTLTENAWNHVVVVANAGSVTFYINGAAAGTASSIGGYTATVMGSDSGDEAFVGQIDETRVYNRALGATEITALYNLGAAKVGASQNNALTNGLVGLWSFDGADVSSTLAYDKSGNGNNGTFSGGPEKVNGRVGQALNFFPGGIDTDANVNVGDPAVLDFAGDFSVGLWFKTTGHTPQAPSYSTGSNMLLNKRNSDAGPNTVGYSLAIAQTTGSISFYANDGVSSLGISSPNAANDNNWHYAVGARSGANLTLYIDGVSVATGTGPTGSLSSTTSFSIGQDTSQERNFNGSIDEVRAYSRALSASEAWDLYQMGKPDKVNSADSQTDPLKKGIVGYWKLDDASGTSATDSSGNANTGTLTNMEDPGDWTSGQVQGALAFDGVNESVSISNISLPGTFTMAWWFNSSDNGGGRTFLGSTTGNVAGGQKISTILNFFLIRLGASISDSSVSLPSTGTWHLAVLTRDSSDKVDLSLDGKAATRLFSDVAQPSTYILNRIGANGSTVDQFFAGFLDEIRVYNRVLSAEEITKLYKTTAPNNPDTSLVGYWSFNGSDISGATTVYDRSGKSNTGTLTGGPAPINGQVGQSIDFDGSDDSISIADAASLDFSDTSDLAITGWFSRDTFTTDDTIFAKRNGIAASDTGYIAYIDDATDKFTFEVSDGTDEYQLESASAFAGTGWHHFAVVMGAAPEPSPALYIDGAYETTVATGNTGNIGDLSNALTLRIGSESDNGNPFDGKLDEIRVYGRTLAAGAVWEQYAMAETVKKTCGTVTDSDTNIYGTVVIGSQCWMRQNMRVGTRIAGSTNQTNNGTIEKFCYSDSDANCTSPNPNQPDGGLYQWDEAMQYSTTAGARGICPSGWHIPTDAEQYTLENYLKDTGQTCDASRSGYDCSSAGTKLKPNGRSGFEGNLTGYENLGSFYLRGSYGRFWSSSESGATAWTRLLNSFITMPNRNADDKTIGLSVRCVQD